jgi:hypothetical protein
MMDSFNKFFKSLIEKSNLNFSWDLNIDEVRYIISKINVGFSRLI